tara:strand:- start:6433 stop:6975 length:543 start_codon:yes stop_codon:yes gene_type:complete
MKDLKIYNTELDKLVLVTKTSHYQISVILFEDDILTEHYNLHITHLSKVSSYKSIKPLLKYASKHQNKTAFPPSPETSPCASKCDLGEVKGDSFTPIDQNKKDITYLEALKDIKSQIEFLNKCAFDKSILTSDEHFALLAIEEELQQLIHFDPIRPDDGLPLRYDVFSIVNGSQLPDNLE